MASVQGGGDPLLSNKIAGAVLGTLLFAMGLNIGSQILFTPKKPAIPGYDLPVPEPAPAADASDQQAQVDPLPVRLASADPAKGMGAAKKCLACHVLDKGGSNKIGPALYGVVERAKGSHEGFAYSSAMKAKGGQWTFDDLDHFLANPKAYVPGTIMAFAGISSPKERADVVRYLQTLADSPVPLPTPTAAPAPAAAPAAAQTEQRPTPAMPGQAAPQAPAPIPATPAPGNTTQSQPGGSTGAANPERPANPTGAVGREQPAPGGGTAPPVRQ